MACLLTKGRGVDCKSSIGGIKRVFFMDFNKAFYGKLDFNGTDTEQIDALDSATTQTYTIYEYDLRQQLSSMTTAINSSPENGTTFFTTTISITLQKLTTQDNKELKLLAYARPIMFVLDDNDNCFAVGFENGCDITTGSLATGTAKGDMSGYTLEFTATSRTMPFFLKATQGSGQTKYPFDQMSDIANITLTTG